VHVPIPGSDGSEVLTGVPPPTAYARAKELYNRALSQPLEAQLEEERQNIARSGATRDFREGIAAFLEKRPARFEGR